MSSILVQGEDHFLLRLPRPRQACKAIIAAAPHPMVAGEAPARCRSSHRPRTRRPRHDVAVGDEARHESAVCAFGFFLGERRPKMDRVEEWSSKKA